MALRASGGRVRAHKRETSHAMVKRSSIPAPGGMAICTICRSKSRPGCRVYRVGGLLPPGEVATGVAAIVWLNCQMVVIVDVTGLARNIRVAIRQRESSCAVIEDGGVPADGSVAAGAIGGGKSRTRRGMHGIVGLLPGSEVAPGITTIVGLDRQVVVVIDVTQLAGNVCVAIREQESRCTVIKFCSQPAIEHVATLAIGGSKGRACFRMIGIGRILPILQVAGIAAGR